MDCGLSRWVMLLGVMSPILALAAASDPDLALAERVFSASSARTQAVAAAAIGPSPLEQLHFRVGDGWNASLELRGPPRVGESRPSARRIALRYEVQEWKRAPQAELVLRIVPRHMDAAEFVQARLDFSEGRTWVRRCAAQSATCTAWGEILEQALTPAGVSGGPGWDHGPLVMPVSTLRRAAKSKDGWSWEGNDFFGRRSRWLWRRGRVWADRIESPQGTVILDGSGESR